jgi:hypothetical protein
VTSHQMIRTPRGTPPTGQNKGKCQNTQNNRKTPITPFNRVIYTKDGQFIS